MKRYYKLLDLRALLSAFGALLLLASCSSYQYAGYDNDGIYSSSNKAEAYSANDYEESYEDALYYKNLFAEKADQFGNVPQEGAIFTDIDTYSSGQYDENMFGEEGIDYQTGRAAWGSDPDQITINLYQDRFYNPFYNPYIHPYYAGFYDPFYGYGHYPYGYGYGYGHPYGYNSWRWNVGWGYGWNYWNHGYRPYYPYYGGHHFYGSNYPYGNYKDVAYANTRRNVYSTGDRYIRSSADSRSTRVQSYSNSRNVRAARSDADRRTYQTRDSRVRSASSDSRRSDTYSRAANSQNDRQVRSQSTRSSNSTSNQVRTTRSSSGNNSGYRSSSSSSRSSGSTGSSSSRTSRGRGN